MNDAAAIVRDYLLAQPTIIAHTGTRIWAELEFPPDGYRPKQGEALVFKQDGTGYQAENAHVRIRWQFKVYGNDVYQIGALYRALLDAMHDTRGRGSILASEPQGPGALLEDPRTGWPFRLEFIETLTYSGLPLHVPGG